MKKVFKNKKTYTFKTFADHFLIYLLGAIVWMLFLDLTTWSKPDIQEIINCIIIFETILLLNSIAIIYRKHLISIYKDVENNRITIKQLRYFRPDIHTELKLNEITISEIKSGWYKYFEIQDNQQKVLISASTYNVDEKKLKKIHHKLHKKLNIDIQNKALAID